MSWPLLEVLQQTFIEHGERLELHVAGLATEWAFQSTWLKCLTPFTSEIRETKGLTTIVSWLTRLPKLQTLAFQLPKKYKDRGAILRALNSNSSLQHLHIHAISKEAAAHAMRFLHTTKLLLLRSLRIVTDGHAACLPCECDWLQPYGGFQNLTCIELGANVSFTGGLCNLRRLRLQRLDWSYCNMLACLINSKQSVSLALDAFTPERLLCLPDSLQDLRLLQKLNANAATIGALNEALGGLANLCRLYKECKCLSDKQLGASAEKACASALAHIWIQVT